MPAPKTFPSSPSTPRLGTLILAGLVAAAPIVGCTTDEESSTGTDGSGGSSTRSVAGADGGAAGAGGVDAGLRR